MTQDIPRVFEQKFGCDARQIKKLVEESRMKNPGVASCTMDDHDISDSEHVYSFDGGPHRLESSTCSEIQCFLTALSSDTFSRLGRGARQAGDRPTHSEYAVSIMNETSFLSLRDTREILHYDSGRYKEGGEVVIEELAESLVTRYETCHTALRREIINTVRVRTYADREIFDARPEILNVKNGLLNIATGEFSAHDTAYPSRVQLDVIYDPGALCTRFPGFMVSILPDHDERITVLEMFAACLVGRLVNLEKIAMFVGEGANGKSTLLRTLAAVLGKPNCSYCSIHSLAENRFSIADLDGKLANIYTDISSGEMSNIGVIKGLVSGDPISADKKNQPAFMLENMARFFFSCNRLPEIGDESEGVYRRFRIIEFNESFEGRRDTSLDKALATEEEKSGILNILVHYARRLLENRRLSYDSTPESVRREWADRTNPVESFVNRSVEADPAGVAAKDEMYQAYARFCKAASERPLDNRGFSSKMSSLGYAWKKVRVEGRSVNAWVGVRLKNADPPGAPGPTAPPSSEGPGDSRHVRVASRDGVNGALDATVCAMLDMVDTMTHDALVSEMLKSGRWADADSAGSHLSDMARRGILGTGIPRRWRCACGAGPFEEGETGFGGKRLEEYHEGEGHGIEYVG